MPVNSYIIFAGGMVAGGLAGYLVARAMYKKEIERLNQEIDDIADKAYKDWCRDKNSQTRHRILTVKRVYHPRRWTQRRPLEDIEE